MSLNNNNEITSTGKALQQSNATVAIPMRPATLQESNSLINLLHHYPVGMSVALIDKIVARWNVHSPLALLQ